MGRPLKVLLVHGAWANASSWALVITRLQARALEVVSIQIPLTSFEDDVSAVRRALAIEDGPILLAAHSYGGGVITEAGNDPKVVGLVYIAAFAPDVGESMESLLGSAPATQVDTQVNPDAQGFLKVTEVGMANEVAQDLPAVDAKLLFATQTPTSFKCLSGAVTVAAWKTRPCWYLSSTLDRIIPPVLQSRMALAIDAATRSVESGHVVLLSKPGDVSDFIAEASTRLS